MQINSFFRKPQIPVVEVDENGMYYLDRYNKMRYMYFVEIKDISLNTGKKIEIVKNGYVPMIKRTK